MRRIERRVPDPPHNPSDFRYPSLIGSESPETRRKRRRGGDVAMARPKSWISRVPAIVDHLKSPGDERLGTLAVQELFGVSASQAKEILGFAGAVAKPGFALSISRESLLYYVENSPEAAEALREHARRQALAKKLATAEEDQRLRRVPIAAKPGDEYSLLRDLPDVTIESPTEDCAGEFRIVFRDREDLLRQLYRFSKAIAYQVDEFNQLTAVKRGPQQMRL